MDIRVNKIFLLFLTIKFGFWPFPFISLCYLARFFFIHGKTKTPFSRWFTSANSYKQQQRLILFVLAVCEVPVSSHWVYTSRIWSKIMPVFRALRSLCLELLPNLAKTHVKMDCDSQLPDDGVVCQSVVGNGGRANQCTNRNIGQKIIHCSLTFSS